jgi:hypothetical protein
VIREKMKFVECLEWLEWLGSTNFKGVFDQILRTARKATGGEGGHRSGAGDDD